MKYDPALTDKEELFEFQGYSNSSVVAGIIQNGAISTSKITIKKDGNLFRTHPLSEEEYGNLWLQQSYYAKPFWPTRFIEDGLFPTDSEMFEIPGYKSNWKENLTNRNRDEYYNEIIGDWSETQDKEHAEQYHKSLVRKYDKILQERMKDKEMIKAGWDKENAAQTIPPLPDAIVLPSEAPYPFETIEQVEAEILQSCCEAVDNARHRFNTVGPSTFPHMGRQLKFIGMETFLLQAVRLEMPAKKAKLRLYFKATDAGSTLKLYGISEDAATSLFGREFAEWIESTFEAEFKRQQWQDIRKWVQSEADKKRYSGTGIDFGGWS